MNDERAKSARAARRAVAAAGLVKDFVIILFAVAGVAMMFRGVICG